MHTIMLLFRYAHIDIFIDKVIVRPVYLYERPIEVQKAERKAMDIERFACLVCI